MKIIDIIYIIDIHNSYNVFVCVCVYIYIYIIFFFHAFKPLVLTKTPKAVKKEVCPRMISKRNKYLKNQLDLSTGGSSPALTEQTSKLLKTMSEKDQEA